MPPTATVEKRSHLASASDVYLEGYCDGLRPIQDINVWQWADKKRQIAGQMAAEPGQYRTSRTPYLREIMEELSPQSDASIIVFMKPTQIGATEVGNNWAFHTIDVNPSPMAMFFPTDTDAINHSKFKFQPSVEETECIRKKLIDNAERGDKTILSKMFPGGVLAFKGAESSRNYRHLTYKYIHADEIDEWPYDVGGQGDPTELLINRMDTFLQQGGKLYMPCSPTIEGFSRIKHWWNRSDQRYYYVPCPLCGEYQVLVWLQLKYTKDSDYNLDSEPEYLCIHCKKKFGEYHKTGMLDAGQWRAHMPGRKVVGFTANSLYSPLGWVSWASLCEEWLRAHVDNDIPKQKRFINTRCAETWKENIEIRDPDVLMNRRETYKAEVPAGACLLTAAVDVQKDRLEVEVKAWGPGFENWGVEHLVIHGSPLRESTQEELDDYIFNSVFKHESGLDMKIRGTGLDTGYETAVCYEYIKRRMGMRIFALKGKGGDRLVVSGPTKDKTTNVKLWTVGTDTVKEQIFGWLGLKEPGGG